MKECEQRAIVKLEYRHNNENFDNEVDEEEENQKMNVQNFMHHEF
jgi:hypothetical protein